MTIPHVPIGDPNSVTGVLVVGREDVCDVRILGLQTCIQRRNAGRIVCGEPVFVTELDVVDLKRLWVTVLGALGSPGSVNGSHAEFQLVESFLNDLVHKAHWPLVCRYYGGDVEGVSAVHTKYWFDFCRA